MRRSLPEARIRHSILGEIRSLKNHEKEAKTFLIEKNCCRKMQNCVDTAFILPQYLVLRTLPVLQVGWLFAIGSKL